MLFEFISTHFLLTFEVQSYSGKEDYMGDALVIEKGSSPVKSGRRCVSCMCLDILLQIVKTV